MGEFIYVIIFLPFLKDVFVLRDINGSERLCSIISYFLSTDIWALNERLLRITVINSVKKSNNSF